MGERHLKTIKTILSEAVRHHRPTQFIDYCKFLDQIFHYVKDRQKYSYQDFSCDLGFGETTLLHQIVRRYRALTLKNAEKIAGKLDLTGAEKKYFLNLIKYTHARSTADRDAAWKDILKIKGQEMAADPDHDILEYFSQWYHPVVREYLSLPGSSSDPGAIAKDLVPSLRPEQIRESLNLLERLNLVALDAGTGKFHPTAERVSTGQRVKTHAIVNYHIQMINLARDSLANIPGKERDVSALTLSISAESFDTPVEITFDFDLRKSLQSKGEGGSKQYTLNPTLRMLKAGEFGEITGTAPDGHVVCVYLIKAEMDSDDNCENAINSAKVKNGKYTLPYMPEGSYKVRVFDKIGAIRQAETEDNEHKVEPLAYKANPGKKEDKHKSEKDSDDTSDHDDDAKDEDKSKIEKKPEVKPIVKELSDVDLKPAKKNGKSSGKD